MTKIKGSGKKIEILEKDNISVTIDSLGAKVLAINIEGENLLYYKEKDIKHSGIPICMPFFGALKNGAFSIDGKAYKMAPHGFFRDSEFELYMGNNKLLAIFKSNGDTLKIYPYKFNFKVTFEIIENGLKMDYVFKNEDSKAMTIAPGFHPYFAVKDRDSIYFTTKAKSGNNSLKNFQEQLLEETDFFEITEREDDLRQLKVINAPNIQLIQHQLTETSIFPGNGSEIILSADMDLFDRMTVWRPDSDVDYICVEPSFASNAVNIGEGIVLDGGKKFETSISIIRRI